MQAFFVPRGWNLTFGNPCFFVVFFFTCATLIFVLCEITPPKILAGFGDIGTGIHCDERINPWDKSVNEQVDITGSD